MDEAEKIKWKNALLYSGTRAHLDGDLGVVYEIVHIHGERVWIKPLRLTRLHDHKLVAGICWCMFDQLVERSRLTWADERNL